jgi:myo-inositol 2-dehydrogenase / D-chiro-inositol 1-dehydrogenase
MTSSKIGAPELSRRTFLQGTAAAAGAALASTAGQGAFPGGSDKVRIAMIGCGNRGTRDAIYCVKSAPGVELVAIADLFQDRVDEYLAQIRREAGECVAVTPDRVFLGFDAYRKVLALKDVDAVLLLTPPGFRALHVAEAVKAGKHMFVEKPGGVDPVGIRSLLDSAAEAEKKGLSIVVGTQQRYAPQYVELVQRLWDGQIGDLRMLKAHWIGDMVDWHFEKRKPEWSDMEWQVRCWPYFTWLSGDHFVEQLCHNIDVCNWILKTPPESCMGLGGRQVRTAPDYGHIYDHFSVEYRYPNGLTMMAIAAQMLGVTQNVSNTIEGTRGTAYVTRAEARIDGEKPWRYQGEHSTGDLAMHGALIRSIREKKPLNELRRLAETTLTAITGRISTYTGKALKYDWALKESQLDLRPRDYAMGPIAVAPVAMPGKTPLV